jgi:transcriptional regulator with XRE-family HTH domain
LNTSKKTQFVLERFQYTLKLLRLKHGLDQQALANKLRISLRKYQRMESGASLPSLSDTLNISKTFNISLDEMFQNKFDFSKASLLNDLDSLGSKYDHYVELISLLQKAAQDKLEASEVFNLFNENEIFLSTNLCISLTNWSKSIFNDALCTRTNEKQIGIRPVGDIVDDLSTIIEFIGIIYEHLPCSCRYKVFLKNNVEIYTRIYTIKVKGIYFSLSVIED